MSNRVIQLTVLVKGMDVRISKIEDMLHQLLGVAASGKAAPKQTKGGHSAFNGVTRKMVTGGEDDHSERRHREDEDQYEEHREQ
jgi:hypothetical protein